MMKILITGVSGFVGKELYQELSEKHQVYGLSRSAINLKNCTTIDFLNKNEVIKYFNDSTFDVIIHLASVMASASNVKNISLLTDNISINNNLIEALRNHNSITFINFSSSAVYPNIDGEFYETSPVYTSSNTDCLYGLSKITGENLFNFLLPSNFKVINLRVGFIYGENMNSTRIHKVFEKELNENNTISVFGNGERIVPQISINKLREVVSRFIINPQVGIFNVAEENINLVEIAQRIIIKKGNANSKILIVERGAKTKFRLNVDRLNSFLYD